MRIQRFARGLSFKRNMTLVIMLTTGAALLVAAAAIGTHE